LWQGENALKNLHVKLLALALLIFASSLIFYKVSTLGLPLFPSDDIEVWSVEARLAFTAKKGPLKAQFMLPTISPGYMMIDENYVSGKYGLAVTTVDKNRVAEWAVRRARGEQVLYYYLQLARDNDEAKQSISKQDKSTVAAPSIPQYPEDTATAITALLEEVRQKSADVKTFTRELLLRFNSEIPDENVQILLSKVNTIGERVDLIRLVLAGARIPSRTVNVLFLREGARHSKLVPWLQVHNEQEWLSFNPENSASELPDNVLIWENAEQAIFNVDGGKESSLDFAISRHTQEPIRLAEQRAREMDSRAMEFSLFSLPIQTQNVYRILLMVPLGALLIVLLRNVVGIKTFGTFMPILIALAFRETELLWGVFLFTLIVGLGLAIRFYLEYLQLLLVPRLAAVLTIVIILMTAVTVFSHKLGFEQGLSIALFPMVILAMTIERMSLIWEEHGPSEALQQGFGSLVVAALGFLLMSNDTMEHMIFVFPEILLILLAAMLLLGRYTGYRLTELWRFRASLAKDDG